MWCSETTPTNDMAEIKIKYYGLERDFTESGETWTKVGIIGAPDEFTYAGIRDSLNILENFRVVPILVRSEWSDVFSTGCIISFKELLVAIKMLCTK